MKLAKLSDWRKAIGRRAKAEIPVITRLKFSGLAGFDDVDINLDEGLLAICGGTGVGKSAVLDLIRVALSGTEEEIQPPIPARLSGATVRLDIAAPSGPYSREIGIDEVDDSWPGITPGFQYVSLAERAVQAFLTYSNDAFELLIEGIAGYDLTGITLDLAKLVCNKPYKSVKIYEVEGVDSADISPLFAVETEYAQYNTLSMATGELSILKILWALNFAAPLSVVLIEEPEAYLPPSTHRLIYSMICGMAVTKKLAVIFTTHSADIASHVPQANILSISVKAGRSSILPDGEPKRRTLSRLGLIPQRSVIIFVEDDLAKSVVEEITAQYEFLSICKVHIVPCGGDGNVRSSLVGLPVNIRDISFIGILDGDLAAMAGELDGKSIIYLPFADATEIFILNYIENNLEDFANSLNRSSSTLLTCIESSAGANYHDRFHDIIDKLNVRSSDLVRPFLRLWVEEELNLKAMADFVELLAQRTRVDLTLT